MKTSEKDLAAERAFSIRKSVMIDVKNEKKMSCLMKVQPVVFFSIFSLICFGDRKQITINFTHEMSVRRCIGAQLAFH